MKIAEIQFTPWDKCYWFDPGEHQLKPNEQVIVKTELGMEMGRVVGLKEVAEDEIKKELKPILRKANLTDIEKSEHQNSSAPEAYEIACQLVKKFNLPMKMIGVHHSFDGGRVTFAFIANGRIDFRELVKELVHHFQKSVRLHQVGIRDEAKIVGGIGPCGQKLCCKTFLTKLGQVNSAHVALQQIAHRGSERLVGVCGRLKCCLKFEQKLYEELSQNLPAIGASFKTPQGKGKVMGYHILKQTVDVALDDDPRTIVEVKV